MVLLVWLLDYSLVRFVEVSSTSLRDFEAPMQNQAQQSRFIRWFFLCNRSFVLINPQAMGFGLYFYHFQWHFDLNPHSSTQIVWIMRWSTFFLHFLKHIRIIWNDNFDKKPYEAIFAFEFRINDRKPIKTHTKTDQSITQNYVEAYLFIVRI